MAEHTKNNPIDWKLIIAMIGLLLSFFGFFFGTNQCNSTNPPPWLIPAMNLLCTSPISPSATPASTPSPTDTPTSPTQTPIALSRVIGSWTNENADTNYITEIIIRFNDNYYSVDTWGKCGPLDCYWPIGSGQVSPRITNIADSHMAMTWSAGSTETLLYLEVLPDGRLMAVVHDPLSEGDIDYTSYFIRTRE